MENNLTVSGDTPVIYKFWKKINNTAIYVSVCGGVATLSRKGLFFPVPKKNVCPAMKARLRPAYLHLSICYKVDGLLSAYTFNLHRAVAEVYLHPKNLFEIEVDHLDGNRDNYHILNLEWVTHEENIRRAVEMRRKRKAEKGGVAK